MTTNREPAANSLIAPARRSTAFCRLVGLVSEGAVSMVAERSKSTRITSGRFPPSHEIHPPAKGRLSAKTRAQMASTRQARIRKCFSLRRPRDCWVARTKNMVAAHWIVRCRRLFSRWMITGMVIIGRP